MNAKPKQQLVSCGSTPFDDMKGFYFATCEKCGASTTVDSTMRCLACAMKASPELRQSIEILRAKENK